MADHDQDDLDLDPELRDLLRELDYADDGPPAALRGQTLDAVRAAPAAAQARHRRRRLGYVAGAAAGVAAAVILALVLVTGGGSTRTVELRGSAGQLTAEVQGSDVTITGAGAALPAGARYELWTVQGDSADPQLTSAGTFTPAADGEVDAELRLPKDTPDGVTLAVTRETDDDPAPNLPPVLSS